MSDINHFIFDSKIEGPSLLCLGAIHGNETCGTDAILKIMTQIQQGHLKIGKGKLTCIPICNPEAYQRKKRYVHANLNRLFGCQEDFEAYEKDLVREISKFINSHDYILDLHSYHSKGNPFIFLDTDHQREVDLAKSVGIKDIITGWPEMYNEKDYTTSGYAHALGKISLTVECGHHHDPQSSTVAYDVLRKTLNYLDMVNFSSASIPNHHIVHANTIHYKAREGCFSKNWQHMDCLEPNEVIASYADGTEIKVLEKCYILLPYENAQIGDEWFYTGTSLENP